ncbi:MAG TPA: hypothetical protein VIU62_13535, partial [Chloroflexota bacterium]
IAPLLRTETPGRHWALVLQAIFNRDDSCRYDARQVAAMQTIGGLLARNARDDRALRYVRMLIPVVPCAWCGREYLRETKLRLHCSDPCRRAAAQLRRPGRSETFQRLGLQCVRCSRPVTGRRRVYCSEHCEQAASISRYRDKRRARRAVQQ